MTRVKLRTFLHLKELLGHREIEVELLEGAIVEDAVEQMAVSWAKGPCLLCSRSKAGDRSPTCESW